MNLAEVTRAAFLTELEKIAKPRYEREIEAGNIRRGDVVPLSQYAAFTEKGRKQKTRASLYETARGLQDDPTSSARKSRLVAEATGPRSSEVLGQIGQVPSSMRPTENPFGKVEPVKATSVAVPGIGFTASSSYGGKSRSSIFLGPGSPSGRYRTLHHELGEAEERALGLGKPGIMPHASHAGLRPLLREDLATFSSPEGQRDNRALRSGQYGGALNPENDNALVRALKKQVGATPNAPVPLEGKQHRALEGLLQKNVDRLSIPTRRQSSSPSWPSRLNPTPPKPREVAGAVAKAVAPLAAAPVAGAAVGALAGHTIRASRAREQQRIAKMLGLGGAGAVGLTGAGLLAYHLAPKDDEAR